MERAIRCFTNTPYDRLRVVGGDGAGQEELGAQQSFVGPQTGQAGVELLPDEAHPRGAALRGAFR